MGLLRSDALTDLLAAADRRHAVIANNLANVNTPGYKTQRLRFAKELDRVLDAQGKVLPGQSIETTTYRPLYGEVNPDGNDVTLEREIVEMNKNILQMRMYLGVLGSRINRLKAAIDSH